MSNGIKSIKRILVIDDNPAIQEDFRKILIKATSSRNDLADMEAAIFGSGDEPVSFQEFDIDCASQGKEGVEMAARAKKEGRPFAMAFVDGRMPPGWDGIETISHLWKECPDIQVVLCTAYADYSWQEIRNVLGESDSLLILKKPFENIEVLQLAHALTRKWELSREVQNQLENLDDLVRQRTEEREQAKMLLEASLKHSPAGIVISNEDGTKILWSNQEAGEIYGEGLLPPVKAETGEGDKGFSTFRVNGTPCPREELPFFRVIMNEEIIRNEEYLLKNTQGQDKWIAYNAAPIRDSNGKKVAGIVIFNDISSRKYTEIEHDKLRDKLAQMQKMESVGLLAGGVAHDYNNMLSVIIGNAEMGMLSIDSSEPMYKTLKEIKKAAHRSADLTQQLLAFARKQPVTPKVLDLNKKIFDMIKILKRLIGEDIDFSWRPGEDLWQINIDPTQIDQILFNLCTNARDAIEGIGKITIETENITISKAEMVSRPELKAGKYTAFKVTDNGRGMDVEILKRIFEPFYTTKELGKGTGLGLATVYGIVNQNSGFMNVESEPGKGSTFTVYLPRFEGEVKDSAVERQEKKNNGKGEKILMVEDTKDVLTIGKAMLERVGYSVISAHTPEEALRKAEESNGSIDLLITDIIMPKMNGHELAMKLQTRHPELKCLYMSGYTADIIAERGVLEKGVNFLQKPFTFTSLTSKVKAALNGGDE